ncbi:MAG: recombinase family protein [Lachnospiraceae bacterium]|nr:recombinase family protein [Lachnospiraceae bacterium]
MIYGYDRVSTIKQSKDGNSLEAQRELLEKNGAEVIFEEKFTGTKTDRPEMNKLLSVLKPGDTLMVTKLDRIARSITKGSELIESLIERDIKVHILNLGVMDNTPASKLIRNIFLSFAEFERDMIVERTQEGKEIARLKEGFREGRPKKYKKSQIEHAMLLLNSYSYSQVSEMTGISVSTLTREKRKYKQ